MICKRLAQGWEVTTQRNHALLSAQMLADWKPEHRIAPWSQLLNACAQHDHGWMEEYQDPLLDAEGEPLDFLRLPFGVSLAIAGRNLRNAEAQSRWCAVLVSRHIEYLFQGKDDPLAEQALAKLQAQRQPWMSDLKLSADRLEQIYELLRWADTFSLLVCCPPSDFTRSLELRAQGLVYQAKGEDHEWTLSPWPYRKDTVHFDYETRRLEQHSFSELEQFRAALRGASVTEHVVTVRPGPA